MADEFSHLAPDGTARMVDVSTKPKVQRFARAGGQIFLLADTVQRIHSDQIAKGNVLGVARIAGIQAVKRTDELIPLCHSLPVQHVEVNFEVAETAITVECGVATTAETGVEMEALTGVMIAALTIYDMCKAVDKSMVISNVRLLEKTKGSR